MDGGLVHLLYWALASSFSLCALVLFSILACKYCYDFFVLSYYTFR